MSKDLKEVREGAMLLSWDRAVQAEDTESAKALRQDCAWHLGGTRRLEKIRAERGEVQISKSLVGLGNEGDKLQSVLRKGAKRSMTVAPREMWEECRKLRNVEAS